MITETHRVEIQNKTMNQIRYWSLAQEFSQIDGYSRAVEFAREEARRTSKPHRVVRVQVTDTFDPGA